MKRFLIPQPSPEADKAGPAPQPKRPKLDGEEEEAQAQTQTQTQAQTRPPPPSADPTKMVTLNVNGLLSRAKSAGDWAAFCAFVERHDPCIIVLQEVWLPASSSSARGAVKADTKAARDDKALLDRALRQHPLSAYRALFSLADTKKAGQMLLYHPRAQPRRVRYTLEDGAPAGRHHSEGRVILAQFDSFDVLATYSVNNGTSHESFERRRAWDAAVRAFLQGRRDGRGGGEEEAGGSTETKTRDLVRRSQRGSDRDGRH